MTVQTQLYCLTAPSGKRYIGVTKKPVSYRVTQHYHFQTAIGRALRKYGNRITAEILAVGGEKYIYELEQRAIDALGTMAPAGYNLREGGRGGRHTEASRRKISIANLGKIVSKETRRKIGIASRARKTTETARRNMSQARKGTRLGSDNPMWGITGENHPCWGKKHSLETRKKMSEAQKRRWARRQ